VSNQASKGIGIDRVGRHGVLGDQQRLMAKGAGGGQGLIDGG
jgi:hypothetical protein